MEATVFVALILLFIYMSVKIVRSNHSSKNPNLNVPGPKKLPFIGNLHLLFGKSLPHRVFRDLAAKYGPLMQVQLGEVPFLIVSSVEVAKQVMRTHDLTFCNRMPVLAATTLTYNYNDIVAAPYGEDWRQLRRICTLELMSAKRVKSFRPIREEENMNLAKWIASAAGSPVNLSERLHLCIFDIITGTSVGDKVEERALITRAIQESLALGSGFSMADLFPSNSLLPLITGAKFKIERIFRLTDRVFQSIIDRHRAAAAAATTDDAAERMEDLIDVLLKYQHEAEAEAAEWNLTTENIKAVILDIFFAGSETSATTLGWAMSEMIRNPTTMKKAQDEVRQVFDSKGYVTEEELQQLKYVKLVIEETLRLHAPAPLLIPRMSSERCEINGYEIPAKTRVMVNAWAMGRDSKNWKDAEKFIPDRFIDCPIDFKGNHFEYIPFGSGRRICPGMSMGVAIVESTLATLLYHFDWEMPCGMKNEELDMTESFGLTVKKKKDLFLVPTVRRPLPMT